MNEERSIVAAGSDARANGIAPSGMLGTGNLSVNAMNFWTSLDLKTERGANEFLASKSGLPESTDKYIGMIVSIRDVVFHECQSTDEKTGEVTNWIRCVLILSDGGMIAGGSNGIRQSLADLFAIKGVPPWTNGLKVKIVTQKTSKKRTMHLLQLA